MKLKRILCMLVAAMTLSAATVYTAFAEENEADSKPEPSAVEETVEAGKTAEGAVAKDAKKDAENAVASLGLENPCEVDENGNVMLEDGKLIDLILPKAMSGEALTSIAAKSFAGCPYIRSVVVPETILEIGEDAFADCEFLETVYVIGHSEEDMTLGANWNGGAEVVYVYDEIQVEEEAPAADAAEDLKAEEQEEDKKDALEHEQAPDAETVKEPESSDPAKESTEGKAPAEEKDSGEQKESQEESDAEQQEDSKDAASSNEAGKASPQSETEESAEGSGDVPASAEVSEGAEA